MEIVLFSEMCPGLTGESICSKYLVVDRTAEAILPLIETAAVEVATEAIGEGTGIGTIVVERALKARPNFCTWHEKDKKELPEDMAPLRHSNS